MQKLALIDAQSTTNDKFKDDQIYGHGLQMVTDAEGNQAELRREGNKVNQKTAEIQNKINETLKDKEAIQTVINTLEQDKANLEKLLIEQGFTMADVENLVAESRKKRSSETKKATKEEDALAKALDTVFDTLGRVLRKNQELEQKTFSALIDSAQSTANAIIQIEQNAADRRLKIDQDLLKSRLEGGLITQERYERELEKLDVKRFNQDKRLARAQALVNGALAITQVYAQTGAFAFAAVAPVIAATLAQVAVIESQQYAKGGLVHGKSHANGGEKFAVGGRVVELEGGEAVINKRSTSMFRSQLSAMNAAGGGVKFADGGLLNMPSFATNQFNAVGMNGLAGAMSQGGRVYVLESDITNTQNNVSLIQSQAGF
jgi:hypothetical protein